jgi:signal peptidase I
MKEQGGYSAIRRSSIAEWSVTILLILFGTTTLCQAFVIPTGSMEDNLLIGDHVLVDKLAYAPSGVLSKYLLPYQEPKHGDIIVFQYPSDISELLVKRLIGVPGDRIRIANGVLYRNGTALNEPYVFHKYDYDPAADYFPWSCCRPVRESSAAEAQQRMLSSATSAGEIIVPQGMYFAMGDNRDNSSDSRYWGFVPRDNIVGKPILIYWSYRASTEELEGQSTGAIFKHLVDIGEHFFTRTRWDRTLKLVRGVPDSALPDHPVPLNRGNPNL